MGRYRTFHNLRSFACYLSGIQDRPSCPYATEAIPAFALKFIGQNVFVKTATTVESSTIVAAISLFLFSGEERSREVAFGGVRQYGHDCLARAEFLGQPECGYDIGA